jgi:predicted O-methyltransferase YrrM
LCSEHVRRALVLVGQADRLKDWQLLPDYSFKVVKNWTSPIDVLFIDGDHRYDAVKQDFEDWLPLVTPGGFIIFHDSCQPEGGTDDKYDYGWPGPSRLVRELKVDPRVILSEQVHSLSIFKKK